MADTPLIECRQVACGYPGRHVLSEVALSVQSGETVALLGKNGSGKSTLLKTLCRLLLPLHGQVLLGGRDLRTLSFSEIARRVATVPQEEHPQFPFTALEVVIMGRLPYAAGLLDSREDAEAARNAMAEADCEDLADRPVIELSGGEKQRVWIARALAQGAPLLLLDEPTSHLDVAHQLAFASLVEKLGAKGYGVIAAVHDLNLAASFAARALLLDGGRVVLDGTMEETLQSSALEHAYGARFEVVRHGSGLRVFAVAL